MSNMSYCRFTNTADDLRDCYEAMDEKLSDEEFHAKKAILHLCARMLVEAGVEINFTEVTEAIDALENDGEEY